MTVWDRSLLLFNSPDRTLRLKRPSNIVRDRPLWLKYRSVWLKTVYTWTLCHFIYSVKLSSKNIGQFNLRSTYKIHNFDRSKTHVLTAHHKKYLSNPEHSNMEYLNIRTYEHSNLRTNQLLNFSEHSNFRTFKNSIISEHSNIEHLNVRILANMRTFELSNNRILANIRTLNIWTFKY